MHQKLTGESGRCQASTVCTRPRGAPISQSKWKHLCWCTMGVQGPGRWTGRGGTDENCVSVPLSQIQIWIQRQVANWTMYFVYQYTPSQHTLSPGLNFKGNPKPFTSIQSSYMHHLWIIWPIYTSWFIPKLYRKPNLNSGSGRVYEP